MKELVQIEMVAGMFCDIVSVVINSNMIIDIYVLKQLPNSCHICLNVV